LSFLLEAIARAHGQIDFVWLHPQYCTDIWIPWFDEFVQQRSWIEHHRITDGSLRGILTTARQLRADYAHRQAPVYAIGFTSLWYGRALWPKPVVWCIQGVPEEKLAHRNGPDDRLAVGAAWRLAQFGPPPKAIVTVSERMGQLVKTRFPAATSIAAPTCVDLETFKPGSPHERRYLTYLGSGAPWQNLGQLSQIWSALYKADQTLRFKIISRDPRAAILKQGLPNTAVEMHAAHGPGEVARHLWDAELGFLIRTPDLVNEVSFPTKFGEYVAAGVPIAATDVGWDFSRIVKSTGCGVLVNWSGSPESIAREILDFRRTADKAAVAAGCAEAATLMSRDVWLNRLTESLQTLFSPPTASSCEVRSFAE
jgi:glycosyltransferase involved in cell wall biosynthesis